MTTKEPNIRLKAARERKGWSQKEVAQKVPVSESAYQNWELGASLPHPRNKLRLCEIFNASLEELGLLPCNDDAPSNTIELNDAKEHLRTSAQALKVWAVDHRGFVEGHLRHFVGREEDLARVRSLIRQKLATGGYITITGPAGQGKSSLIAKLIHDDGENAVAHHFIPVNPSPGHQVELLCDLLARLILKHRLSETYLADRQLPTLRSALKHVLGEIAAKGTPEVIYLDGLDQIKSELDGKRDLSFLPEYVPPGIVFVLGTRPNDTLQPLKVLKFLDEYELSHLKRTDFDLLLKQCATPLLPSIADRLYDATGGNALYLGLVSEELQRQRTIDPETVLQRIKQAPHHLFSFALDRLKEPWNEWWEVVKPTLGVLLIAKEPLGIRQMHQILGIEEDLLQIGIKRLDRIPLYKYEAAKKMMEGLLSYGDKEKALHLLHVFWRKQEDRDNALLQFCLVQPFIVLKPELGMVFDETFGQVDEFLKM